MFQPNRKMLLTGVVLAATWMMMLGAGSSTADAWWGYHHQVSWACSPCYAPYAVTCGYDPCCDPCDGWYLGYRPGPIRRALFGSCRWHNSGYGACYGWGCTSCDTVVDTCCGDETAQMQSEASPSSPTPAVPQDPTAPADVPGFGPEGAAPTPPPIAEPRDTFSVPTTPSPLDAPPGDNLPPMPTDPMTPLSPFGNPGVLPADPMNTPSSSPLPEARYVPTPADSGLLTIWVPYDAKVTINGMATKSVGSRRQYVSYGMQSGFDYRYEIHAEVVRDGRVYEDVRVVTMTAGARSAVAFGFNISSYEDLAAAR